MIQDLLEQWIAIFVESGGQGFCFFRMPKTIVPELGDFDIMCRVGVYMESHKSLLNFALALPI
ncbi:hypothetical protein [Cyclobacterium sp. 1_MG-2023]|uniref:hypothetical protein n=1 Tax=Cyclobacterium sp. 1_MG-2023 TaxID=3062681 RepID=UPI0026E2D459|nr:hypothetical protein [Cyclobacterium sp. 1_MG-2023]